MDINGITDIARFLTDEGAAQEALTKLRWPNGVVCPLCEGGKKVYEVSYTRKDKDGAEVTSVRRQWKCGACRKKFSVTSRSIFEGAHIAVGKWIYAIFLMCSSKKGVSANQLSRELDITYKSAWFMCHRVREAMLQGPLNGLLGAKGEDGIVELDETFVGGKKKNNRHADRTPEAGRKVAVMTLLDREGEVKTVVVPNVRKGTLQKLARPIVDPTATIVTDAHLSYQGIGDHFAGHYTVDHSSTFVRGIVHTNFAESYHSLLKRGIVGAFHHVSEKHLPRYLAEFDRRWNTRKERDGTRTVNVIETAFGKRLRYAEIVCA